MQKKKEKKITILEKHIKNEKNEREEEYINTHRTETRNTYMYIYTELTLENGPCRNPPPLSMYHPTIVENITIPSLFSLFFSFYSYFLFSFLLCSSFFLFDTKRRRIDERRDFF